MPSCAPSKLRARQDSQEDNRGPSHALGARRRAIEF
jgi:hypothetical protein